MKRILGTLVLILLVSPAFDTAVAKTRKRVREKEVVAVEIKSDEEREREREGVERATETSDRHEQKQVGTPRSDDERDNSGKKPIHTGPPVQRHLKKAKSKKFDLRSLPQRGPTEVRERPELEGPEPHPTTIEAADAPDLTSSFSLPLKPIAQAVAPAPIITFDGLDRLNFGSGSPPDTNGDAGTDYYIQSVNSSVGIYRKSDGFREAAFSFDTFMAQGSFGNLCDTNNFGDPVVLYDTFDDRWVITDFAFKTNPAGNVLGPAFQCFAVSMNGNPLTGGWNYYSIESSDYLNDYPKLGVWPDGIYMSANMFSFGASAYKTARAWAFNKAQMYAGAPTVGVVSFDLGTGDFTVVPSNARLQTGAPPTGRPNLFISTWNYLNALTVYKFHVDWSNPAASTFTGPDTPGTGSSWPNIAVGNAPQPGTATLLDVLQIRAMVQNQYTNFAGAESLWLTHTVRRANTTGFAAPRWYQLDVSGGTVAATTTQTATWDPDAANVLHRFMPSLAVDRTGNMAIGYSTSSTTVFPSIAYAGRVASDPVNTFSYTEQSLLAGTASQTGSTRWGDYSSMTLDPKDGCTFWYTTEYANPVSQASNQRWLTRVGSFKFPECVVAGAGGTLSGTVTATVGGAAISGATVTLGGRTTTTNGAGGYSFTALPAGTYPALTATAPGYQLATSTAVVVTDGGTTTRNLSLDLAVTNSCPIDTTQLDFQQGELVGVDLSTSPGDVKLINPDAIDQINTTWSGNGGVINTTAWSGQTFTSALTGKLRMATIVLFCSACSGTPQPLTLSVRATSAGLPTGADLAAATIPGFLSNTSTYYTVVFPTPATLTAGTLYALVIRPNTNPTGTYAINRSGTAAAGTDVYAGGQRVISNDAGGTWAVVLSGSTTPTQNDAGFIVYINNGFVPTGTLISPVKDSNALGGLTSIWSTLSWNASAPANTSAKMQVAGSNSASGPFNFVGPDGTAATFFTTSPASLDLFYGQRFIQYKAILQSADSLGTPVLNDVTVCYSDADCSGPGPVITPTPAQACESSTGNTASGPAGMTSYSWSITNGTITSSTTSQSVTYTAGASGTVGLTLNVVEPSGCHKSNTANVTIINVPTPTITPGGPTTFCTGGSVTLTSSSGSGNQWYLNGNPIGGETNATYLVTATGDYTVIVTTSGCTSAPSAATTVTVNPIPPTPTITPGGSVIACDSGTLTSSSASGNQWYYQGNLLPGETNQTLNVDNDGDYTVVVTLSGCSSSPSAATSVDAHVRPGPAFLSAGGPTTFCTGGTVTLSSNSATGIQWYLDGNPLPNPNNQNRTVSVAGTYTVTLNNQGCIANVSNSIVVAVNPIPATPTITPGGPTTFCTGGSVTLTSSSATGNQWYLNGNPIGGETNQTYIATATGSYTVVVTASGCSSAPSAATAVTVNSTPTPTITPGGPTTFCTGGSVTLTSSSATGNQWYLNGNPIGGETNQTYIATASGGYTVVATTSGCPSTPSATTTVTVNPIPATPTITPGGPTTFCAGGSVLLTSSSGSGNQWYLDGNPIGGATNATYSATATGSYTVIVTTTGCSSAASSATTVTVNPVPATPTITPGGPTTFCTGGSVLLTSSSATGNQWYLNGNPIGGATNATYGATASGSYTVVVTATGCSSAPSAATTVTVNPIPATPTITPGGPTTFCAGGSVTLTSSSASGNQWYLGGNPIGGATNQAYVASAGGDYTVIVTATGCSSAASAATTVTVNPNPNATITAPASTVTASTGNAASVANAGAGATYSWSITNGTITAGAGTANITFTAGAIGPLTLNVTVTTSAGCPVPGTATVNVTAPAQQFDANGDGLIDPSDVFYLVNYLYSGGPVPAGPAGLMSGDANGDSVVDPADIFYVINFLFLGGPQPAATPNRVSMEAAGRLAGSVILGAPVVRQGRTFIPVMVSAAANSREAQSLSLKVRVDGDATVVAIRRSGVTKNMQPVFELTRPTADGAAWLIALDSRSVLAAAGRTAVVGEIEISRDASQQVRVEVDPALTMLSRGGVQNSTVPGGTLSVRGVSIEPTETRPHVRERN
jgi:hypothetical protein